VKSATPIYYWIQIQQNENNTQKLIELTKEFTTSQLSTNDIYQNKIGRYALLIYQIISKNSELDTLSKQLFITTKYKLELNQVNVDIDTSSRQTLEKRTWYRLLYAYCNYMEANILLEKGKAEEASNYFKAAFDYSPDLADKDNASAYSYDLYFLLNKNKSSFHEEYLEYLTNYSNEKNRTLSTLLTMSLVNPVNKEKLHTYYSTNFPNEDSFENFWLNGINKNLKSAPDFSLTKIDGKKFSLSENLGKWTLLDFWGTWCMPCRKEHPDLQGFYKYLSTKDIGNFALITIACKDIESDVTAYLTQNNYNFPVAMANDSIEALYNVKGYPTKVLITPQGKFLVVPFGIDWVDFIKKYAGI
jgi:thiol-disulfide isomerase/thioredoxin